MAVSEHAAGTQAATVGTEHFLGTDPDTTDGVFQFVVGLDVLAAGDELEVRVYEKARSTSTTAYTVTTFVFANAQNDKLWVSPAFILLHGWRFSIKQTAGTGRTFEWSIRKVA